MTSGVLGTVVRHVNLDSIAESILPSCKCNNVVLSTLLLIYR